MQCCVIVLCKHFGSFITGHKNCKQTSMFTFVTASTFSPLASSELMTDTWPFMAAVWIPRAPFLFGISNGTPFLNRTYKKQNICINHIIFKWPFFVNTIAVSGCPLRAAMCISVLPSLVRSKTEALNLSARNSTVAVWPRSAAKCSGVRSEVNRE